MAESPNLKNLRTLVVCENNVRGKGAKALAKSPNLVNLTTLDIGYNTIGAKGARALAESPNLKNLRTLDITCNQIRIYSRNKVISHCNDLGIIVII